jgi:hypothetical protein
MVTFGFLRSENTKNFAVGIRSTTLYGSFPVIAEEWTPAECPVELKVRSVF